MKEKPLHRLNLDKPSPADLTRARLLLARLSGSTPRDRTAFTFGYVLAFDQMARDLTDAALRRHLHLARALHEICSEDHS